LICYPGLNGHTRYYFKECLNNSVLEFLDHDKIAWTQCQEQNWTCQWHARRAHTMEGMRKSKNAIVAFLTFSMA
jgi:hypothetical protein